MTWLDVPGFFAPGEGGLWQTVCRGRRVLELGRYLGRSAACAAEVAALVVSVDRVSPAAAEVHLGRLNLGEKVRCLTGDFADVLPGVHEKFDAVLVDGDHAAKDVGRDVRLVLGLLAAGAVIGFHDYDNVRDPRVQFPDVKPAADALAEVFAWKLLDVKGTLAVFTTG